MIRKFSILLILFALIMPLFAPKPSFAEDAELVQLRIAATLSLEVGGSNQESLNMVAAVIQERYQQQNKAFKSKTTWADVLYGNNAFEHSRGFASKTKEELRTYIKNKSGSKWLTVMQTAEKVRNKAMNTSILKKQYKGKTYTINGFMMRYSGGEKTDKKGRIIQTGKLYKDGLNVDYFWADLGKITGYKNYVKFNEDSPYASHKYDNAIVDRYINGAKGNYSSGSSSGGSSGGSSSEGGGSSGGDSVAGEESSDGSSDSSGAYAEPTEKARQCSFDEMQKLYMDAGEDACWYCNVVVILTNAYLKSAGKALGSAKELGKLILKLGFSVWLALYILQQVSSFAPIASSKIIQEILLMSFKVALAYLAVDAAETVIVTYFLNPIGQLGIDYGGALFDKLTT